MSSPCRHGEDAGAYVLNALEDDEARAYAAHLDTCAPCREEVAALQVVVDTLPAGAPRLSAPPELKRRIMAVVEAEAELLRASGPEADRVPAPVAAKRGRLGRLSGRPGRALALACTILVVGGVAGVAIEHGRDGGPSTRTVQAAVTGQGRAALELTGSRAALKVDGVPSLPEGRVYQVWFVKPGRSTPEPTHTLFNVRRDGRATVAIEESVKGVKQVLVTAEPDGGSRQPTSAPVISATAA
jgi:anti-sigma-K factor RskA